MISNSVPKSRNSPAQRSSDKNLKNKLDEVQARIISATIRKIVPIEKILPVPSVSSSIDVSGGRNSTEGKER